MRAEALEALQDSTISTQARGSPRNGRLHVAGASAWTSVDHRSGIFSSRRHSLRDGLRRPPRRSQRFGCRNTERHSQGRSPVPPPRRRKDIRRAGSRDPSLPRKGSRDALSIGGGSGVRLRARASVRAPPRGPVEEARGSRIPKTRAPGSTASTGVIVASRAASAAVYSFFTSSCVAQNRSPLAFRIQYCVKSFAGEHCAPTTVPSPRGPLA